MSELERARKRKISDNTSQDANGFGLPSVANAPSFLRRHVDGLGLNLDL